MKYALLGILVLLVLVGLLYLTGARLPVAHRASVQFRLAQPPVAVFAVLTDITSAPAWRSGLRSVEVSSRQGEPLRWRETSSFGPLDFAVEEATPPQQLRVRVRDPDHRFGGVWTYELQEEDGGTVLTITEDGEVYNPLFRLLSRYVFGHYGTIEQYGRDLARRFGEEPRVERLRA